MGGYGKQSDGGTFRSSPLFQLLESKRLNIPEDDALPSTTITVPYVCIGDEAYPLLNNLMKPFNRRNLNAEKEYFNMRLSRTRRVVECAFGIINAKFRILWKPIETSSDLADSIIKCICILHNIINDLEGITIEDKQLLRQCESVKSVRENNRPSANANFIRETYKMFVCQNKKIKILVAFISSATSSHNLYNTYRLWCCTSLWSYSGFFVKTELISASTSIFFT